MPLIPDEYIYSVSNIEFMRRDTAEKQFKKITGSALPLFLRGGDTITITPSVAGFHEDDVESVIRWAARNGHGDFDRHRGQCRIDLLPGRRLFFSGVLLRTQSAGFRHSRRQYENRHCAGCRCPLVQLRHRQRKFHHGIARAEKQLGARSSLREIRTIRKPCCARMASGVSMRKITSGRRSRSGRRNLHWRRFSTSFVPRASDPVSSRSMRKVLSCRFEAVSRIVPADIGLVIVFENHLRDVTREQLVSLFRPGPNCFFWIPGRSGGHACPIPQIDSWRQERDAAAAG